MGSGRGEDRVGKGWWDWNVTVKGNRNGGRGKERGAREERDIYM